GGVCFKAVQGRAHASAWEQTEGGVVGLWVLRITFCRRGVPILKDGLGQHNAEAWCASAQCSAEPTLQRGNKPRAELVSLSRLSDAALRYARHSKSAWSRP